LHERLRNLRYERMLFIRHSFLERQLHKTSSDMTSPLSE
jgi:hypothetical protein